MRYLAILLLIGAIAFAMSTGAPSFNCKVCHSDAKPIPPQDIVIKGLPQYYVPGKAYKITIEIKDVNKCTPAMLHCGGFALQASAGQFKIIDHVHTQLKGNMVTLTAEGAKMKVWTVEWIAPKTPKPVTFKVAVLAANSDFTPFGDHFGMKVIKAFPERISGLPKCEPVTKTVTVTKVDTVTVTVTVTQTVTVHG